MAVTAGQLQEITGCGNELAAEYAPMIGYYAQQYNVDVVLPSRGFITLKYLHLTSGSWLEKSRSFIV